MTNIINFKDAIAKRGAKNATEASDAEKIRDEYRKAEQKLAENAGKKEPDDPVSMLTELVTGQLAYSAAESFKEMTGYLDDGDVREIIQRMDESGSEMAAMMLQAMFLVTGDRKAAQALDILTICGVFDNNAYDMFIDELFESEPFDMILMDIASGMKIKGKDGVKTLTTDHFTLTLSHGDSWNAKVNSKNSITIYNVALNKAKRGGKLVTILAFKSGDNSYDVLPDYNAIGESGGMVYIAAYPTDVQFDESDNRSTADYMAVFEEVGRLAEGNEGNPMVFREEGV